MSLLNDASLVLIPSGYKEDKVYSIIPSDGSGDLDFVRGSEGTRINSLGQVENVCWNKLQYSEQINNTAAWQLVNGITISANSVVSPTGTLTADTLIDNGSGISIVRQFDYAVIGGQTYTFSIWLKKASGAPLTRIRIEEDAAPYNSTYLDVTPTDVWTRYSVTRTLGASISALNIGIFPDRNSGDSVYAWGAQLNVGSTAKPYFPTTDRLNVPRLTYENGCPSLLLEKQSSNIITYSEDLTDSAWIKSNATISANATISPDGTQNADKLIINNGATGGYTYRVNSTSATPYTGSFYIKAGGVNYTTFYTNMSGSYEQALINLTNGAITNSTFANTPKTTSVGNGWYRVEYTTNAGSGAVTIYIDGGATSGGGSFIGNGVDGIYIWGAQVEASAYPTSYIPTTSTSVTRLLDQCNKTSISSLIGQGEGSILLDFNFKANNESILFDITNNSLAVQNRIILYTPGNYYIYLVIFDNGTNTVQIESAQYSLSQRMKVGVRYKNNDTALYINGTQIGVDTSCSMPTVTLSRIDVGNRLDYTYPSMISVNQSLLFTRGLTDTELAQLTTL